MATKKKRKPAKKKPSDAKIYVPLAILVVVLGGLVWWSLPGHHAEDPIAPEDAEAANEEELAIDAGPPKPLDKIERPPRANGELAIIVEKPEEQARTFATASEIARRLETKHCASACDAVRKFLTGEDGFEIDVRPTEEIILPPKDTYDTVAATLTPSQRDSIDKKTTSITMRAIGVFSPEQVPTRALYAAALVVAETLEGFVYDETERRIEDVHDFAQRMITSPLGEPAFARQNILIQLYRQGDGTARLRSLGLQRFGAPDLAIRGANMGSAPLLAEVINAVARQVTYKTDKAPLTVSLLDIAQVTGKKPNELAADPGASKPVTLDLVEAEQNDGDPDDIFELTPQGGSTREGWDAVYGSLFGPTPSVKVSDDDKELAAIAAKAKKDLPGAIKRFQAGEGELFVKGPFPIPEDERADGGPSSETLWISALSCDAVACTGTLSNEPSYMHNLAAGKTTSVQRSEVVDWMLRLKNGKTAGGESIKVLQARRP